MKVETNAVDSKKNKFQPFSDSQLGQLATQLNEDLKKNFNKQQNLLTQIIFDTTKKNNSFYWCILQGISFFLFLSIFKKFSLKKNNLLLKQSKINKKNSFTI